MVDLDTLQYARGFARGLAQVRHMLDDGVHSECIRGARGHLRFADGDSRISVQVTHQSMLEHESIVLLLGRVYKLRDVARHCGNI